MFCLGVGFLGAKSLRASVRHLEHGRCYRPTRRDEWVASALQPEWARGHLAHGFGVHVLCVRPRGLQRGLDTQLLLAPVGLPSPIQRQVPGSGEPGRIRGLLQLSLQRCISAFTSRVQGVEVGKTRAPPGRWPRASPVNPPLPTLRFLQQRSFSHPDLSTTASKRKITAHWGLSEGKVKKTGPNSQTATSRTIRKINQVHSFPVAATKILW